MHTVEILLNQTDLRDQMSAMRVWLDERRYETSVFNYHQDIGGILLVVGFGLAAEAEAFANRFAGRLAGNQRHLDWAGSPRHRGLSVLFRGTNGPVGAGHFRFAHCPAIGDQARPREALGCTVPAVARP
jgi:hypothetical protein